MRTRKTDLTVFIALIVRRNLTKNGTCSDVLEHKESGNVALEGVLADGTTRRENRYWSQFGSMVANDAAAARLRRLTRSQQILLPAIENKSKALMSNSEQAGGARHTPVGNLKGAFD